MFRIPPLVISFHRIDELPIPKVNLTLNARILHRSAAKQSSRGTISAVHAIGPKKLFI
jgi:hypothetical protein